VTQLKISVTEAGIYEQYRFVVLFSDITIFEIPSFFTFSVSIFHSLSLPFFTNCSITFLLGDFSSFVFAISSDRNEGKGIILSGAEGVLWCRLFHKSCRTANSVTPERGLRMEVEKEQNFVFEKKKDEVVNHVVKGHFENQPNVMEKQRNVNHLNDLNDLYSLSNQDEKTPRTIRRWRRD
jgi:hypothetical protein